MVLGGLVSWIAVSMLYLFRSFLRWSCWAGSVCGLRLEAGFPGGFLSSHTWGKLCYLVCTWRHNPSTHCLHHYSNNQATSALLQINLYSFCSSVCYLDFLVECWLFGRKLTFSLWSISGSHQPASASLVSTASACFSPLCLPPLHLYSFWNSPVGSTTLPRPKIPMIFTKLSCLSITSQYHVLSTH